MIISIPIMQAVVCSVICALQVQSTSKVFAIWDWVVAVGAQIKKNENKYIAQGHFIPPYRVFRSNTNIARENRAVFDNYTCNNYCRFYVIVYLFDTDQMWIVFVLVHKYGTFMNWAKYCLINEVSLENLVSGTSL